MSIPDALGQSKPTLIAPYSAQKRWSLGFAAVLIGFLIALEIWIRLGNETSLFLPAPSVVIASLGEMIRSGALVGNLGFTLARIAAGLFIGSVIGVSLGLGVGTSRRIRWIVDPIVAALHPIPRLAFFPLLIVLFGLGEMSKIAAVSMGAFFPMFLNTVAGVHAMNPVHIDLGRNYGADRRQVFLHVILPGATPLMLTGLRLSANTAFHVTIGVEMVGARTGLGAMLWLSWQTFRIDNLYAVLIVIAAIGIGLATFIRWISTRAAPWMVERPTVI